MKNFKVTHKCQEKTYYTTGVVANTQEEANELVHNGRGLVFGSFYLSPGATDIILKPFVMQNNRFEPNEEK